MNQRLVIPVLVVLAFGAGYGARVWTERDPVLPPPPAPGSEFTTARTASASDAKPESKSAKYSYPTAARAKFIAEIEKIRPQIDTFRKRLDEIDAEFDQAFATLLRADQRERFDAQQKKDAEHRSKADAKIAADPNPLSDDQVYMLQQRPYWSTINKLAISARLDRAVREYKLDDAQKNQFRHLLEVRRDKFVALLESTPPPSLMYSQLATQTQKLLAGPTEPAK